MGGQCAQSMKALKTRILSKRDIIAKKYQKKTYEEKPWYNMSLGNHTGRRGF